MNTPHRRFTVSIRISGDTWEDLREALNDLAGQQPRDMVLGGPTKGYTVKVKEDPQMTHEKYHAELETFLAAREVAGPHPEREAKGGDWDGDCG